MGKYNKEEHDTLFLIKNANLFRNIESRNLIAGRSGVEEEVTLDMHCCLINSISSF